MTQVTLYRGQDQTGNSTSYGVGRHDVATMSAVGNDRTASIRVPPGLEAVLYADRGLKGTCQTFGSGDAPVSLPGGVSSIRVLRP